MRLFLDTCIRWLIAAGMWLGAIAYFRVPSGIDLTSFYIHVAAAAMGVGAMVVVSVILLHDIYRWLVPLISALFMSLGVCVYYRIEGAINFNWEPMNSLATIVIVLALWSISFHVIARTNRFLNLLNCWCDPSGIKAWMADLDSQSLLRKSLAVQTLADYFGRNLGGMENWPFAEYRSDELEVFTTFIKKLYAAKEATVPECPSQERLFPQLARNMKETFWRLAQCRVDWMISRIPEYFRRDTSEPETFLASPDPLPPLDPVRLVEAMDARITETLQNAAQFLNEAPGGSLIVDSEEPVGELLAQLFLEAYQVALALRIQSGSADSEQPGSLSIPPASRSLAPTWKLSDGGSLDVIQLFRQVADNVKDTLLDLNLMAEEVQIEPATEDLPFMSPEEFIVMMRPHVEEALERLEDITNQTPTGLILVAEEPTLCRIFAQVHARALELGLELRLRLAERLSASRKPQEKDPPGLHLRKAASPGLPAPFMGWAAKYRCMRIAGTRFPLIHQGPEKCESSRRKDDPHITSVKPGRGGAP